MCLSPAVPADKREITWTISYRLATDYTEQLDQFFLCKLHHYIAGAGIGNSIYAASCEKVNKHISFVHTMFQIS